jgi:outer membrane protein assembly factor BamB
LLTLDQGTLYFNTNLGIVAALHASSGSIRWLTTYPRGSWDRSDPDQDHRHAQRDLVPCLVYRDFVFVAPTDSDCIFALDAITGHPLWMTQPEQVADAVHLLGVGAGNLLASGDCLYWLDLNTGRLVSEFPHHRSGLAGRAGPSPRGYGRGVLAGPYVYWPTRDTIFVLEQATVRTPRGWEPVVARAIPLAQRGASGGNLLIADGILLVAAADRLMAFNETGRPDHARGP